jgi:predicted HicB family RNase H-like nuclease
MNKEKNQRYPRVNNKPKTMSLRVSIEMYEKIRNKAESENVSLTSVLTKAVVKYIHNSDLAATS